MTIKLTEGAIEVRGSLRRSKQNPYITIAVRFSEIHELQ